MRKTQNLALVALIVFSAATLWRAQASTFGTTAKAPPPFYYGGTFSCIQAGKTTENYAVGLYVQADQKAGRVCVSLEKSKCEKKNLSDEARLEADLRSLNQQDWVTIAEMKAWRVTDNVGGFRVTNNDTSGFAVMPPQILLSIKGLSKACLAAGILRRY